MPEPRKQEYRRNRQLDDLGELGQAGRVGRIEGMDMVPDMPQLSRKRDYPSMTTLLPVLVSV